MKTKLSIITAILLLGATAITADDYGVDESGISEEMQEQMALDREADEALAVQEAQAVELDDSEQDVLNSPDEQSSDDIGVDATGVTYYGTGAGTNGNYSSYFGYDAGKTATGSANSFFGWDAGNKISGYNNVMVGSESGKNSTSAYGNVFIGNASGWKNTEGDSNIFIGAISGYNNKNGSSNIYIGSGSGYTNDTASSHNTFVGYYSGYKNRGDYNSFFGHWTGHDNTSGTHNLIMGSFAGRKNTTGGNNTFLGADSGYNSITGYFNTFLGNGSGYNNKTGHKNIFIGSYAGYNETGSDRLYIDSSATTKPLIWGDFYKNLLRVNGTFETVWAGLNTIGDGATQLLVLSADNAAAGKTSDAGFSMENVADDFTWTFRTYSPEEGFAATKIGTSGPEFEVANTTTNYRNAVVKMGGVTVFRNGHLVNRSGVEITSLINEQSKVLANTRAELKTAKSKIAKLETIKAEYGATLAKLEIMQKKVAMMESILTNLALDSSHDKEEKLSMK